MTEIPYETLKSTCVSALIAHGAAPWVAELVGDATARSEAEGNKVCGLFYLESYCLSLAAGRVKGDAEPVVTRPRPSAVVVDAQNGFAQPAFARGLQDAVMAALENGIAVLSVGHSHTATSLGYFTRQIAEAGLISLGFTNASAVVAGPGGRTPIIGTNPLAFSVPDGQGGVAMQVDQSTSAVALGQIKIAKREGRAIPEGWAVDAEGQPTTDPAAGLDGALSSSGGYKGWGLGLMVEVLAAGLTGGVNSLDVKGLTLPDGPPHDLGQLYLLIDPGLSAHFEQRLQRLSDAIDADPGARMPGRGGKALADPVPVDDVLWARAQDLAAV